MSTSAAAACARHAALALGNWHLVYAYPRQQEWDKGDDHAQDGRMGYVCLWVVVPLMGFASIAGEGEAMVEQDRAGVGGFLAGTQSPRRGFSSQCTCDMYAGKIDFVRLLEICIAAAPVS
jgi:hypothetical protein